MEPIRLSDAIAYLREELKAAQHKAQNEDLKFNVGSAEIELEVVAEREKGGSGKVNWWVFNAGIDAKNKDISKHKLKLTLQAVQASHDGTGSKRLQVGQEQYERPE
jgi:Trypsin-co-occurring domain 2